MKVMCHLTGCNEKNIPYDIPAQDIQLASNHAETSDKPKLRDSLQNN